MVPDQRYAPLETEVHRYEGVAVNISVVCLVENRPLRVDI